MGTVGRSRCGCQEAGTEPPKSSGCWNPKGGAVPTPSPRLAGPSADTRLGSLPLLQPPLPAGTEEKGEKRTKPKGQRTTRNLPGRKGQLWDARGGAQPFPGLFQHRPEPKRDNGIYWGNAAASEPKSQGGSGVERGHAADIFNFHFFMCCSLFGVSMILGSCCCWQRASAGTTGGGCRTGKGSRPSHSLRIHPGMGIQQQGLQAAGKAFSLLFCGFGKIIF